MGLSPADLEQITPYQFNLLLEGYQKRLIAEENRTRILAWMTYATTPKEKGAENMSIYEFWPLPGDPEPEVKPLTTNPDEDPMRLLEQLLNNHTTQ